MVVYYLNKVSERLADYRYPIKEGDICMLYDGDAVKTIYVDSETEADSIWRDFKFIDSKSLKSYHLPKTDSVLCAPVGDKHAIGNAWLLTQLIQECKGEWLLDFLNETSAVLSGFVDYWDLMVLRRLTGDDYIEVAYGDKEALSAFIAKPVEDDDEELEDDDEGEYIDVDILTKSYDIKWFCLSALSCIEGQMKKRSYQILHDTLKGDSRSEIASRFHLTQERIRQIVVKATKQAKELLTEQRKSLEETKAENAKLKVQMNLLREDLAGLKKLVPQNVFIYKSEEGDINAELTELLETSLRDINLPARATNILMFMKVDKFADIPQIESSTKLLKVRNSGRKTLLDVSHLLEDFHLTFGMSFKEIVDVLKKNDWHDAKRKWMVEGEEENHNERNEYNNDRWVEKHSNVAFGKEPNARLNKEDERIGWTVRLFPSQQIGVIVNVRTDGKGMKKLVVKTSEGNTMVIDDMLYLYEVLRKSPKPAAEVGIEKQKKTENVETEEATVVLTKEIIEAARTPNGGYTRSQLAAIGIDWPAPQNWIEEKVGMMITPTQLANFNRIEYVAKPSETSYQLSGSKTYKDVASSLDDRRKMEAILQAMTHFYNPATPHDIARTISRTAWGANIVREETVDTFLKLLPEVEYVKWGKYILKSRKK